MQNISNVKVTIMNGHPLLYRAQLTLAQLLRLGLRGLRRQHTTLFHSKDCFIRKIGQFTVLFGTKQCFHSCT